MKEKLYTIELTDALKADEECPFCFLERKLLQDAIGFVLGSSYMESDIREETDRMGFCRLHTKMMYDYGNSLGNAWIFKTRLSYLRQELEKQKKGFTPGKAGLFGRKKPKGAAFGDWIRDEESHCYLCNRVKATYGRMLNTFVYMANHDHTPASGQPSGKGHEDGFFSMVERSKGFCIHHFADLMDICDSQLGDKEKEVWFPMLFGLMEKNLNRLQEDIDWFIEKYDYRNADADWRQSKDALPRTMQKIAGGYPADPVFKNQK